MRGEEDEDELTFRLPVNAGGAAAISSGRVAGGGRGGGGGGRGRDQGTASACV